MSEFLRGAWTVARKDLTIEGRTWHRLVVMAAFALLAGVLFHYALEASPGRNRVLVSGLVWITILFAGVLGVGRSFQLEEENRALEGLLLTPLPPGALYLGKVLANYLLVLVVAGFTLGVLGLFFTVSFRDAPAALYLLLALGMLGFVSVGTLFSAVTARASMGESLLPVLLFPLLVPVVVFGAGATSRLLAGLPASEAGGSMRILTAYALVGLVAGVVLTESAVEDG